MNRLDDALRQTAEHLGRYGGKWALVGGFAVSARAVPRFTRAVDIAVSVDDDSSAEVLVRQFMSDGYGFAASVEHDNGRLATVRLKRGIAGVDVMVDILFASSGIEPEIARAAEELEIVPGLSLPVATVGHLIALKLLARDDQNRPQDLADLHALFSAASKEDIAGAHSAVQLITERGFHRGRDLVHALGEMMSR